MGPRKDERRLHPPRERSFGAAAFDRAEERRIELLKQAGFNAIRTSHNPPSPAILDACDRLGMLVMDESFDCWSRGKNKHDYSVVFADWWQRDIDAMVLRDRNHPSVVLWSIGNEVPERGEPLGAKECAMIADYLRTLDKTRPITSALNFVARWTDTDGFYQSLDVAGYNYNLTNHAADHKRVPARVMACTESFPRATFDDWAMVNDFPYIVGTLSGLPSITWANRASDGPPCATPRTPPRRLWGAISVARRRLRRYGYLRRRRAIAHYRNIVWDRGEKLYLGVRQSVPEGKSMSVTQWGVWPVTGSWNWPGMEGKSLDVEVYTRGDSVRLYLNDQLLGEKPVSRAQKFIASFSVPYAAGVLKAVALRDGKNIGETVLRTAGEPAQVRLTADRSGLRADGQDLSFILVEALDKNGRPHPNAEHEITFRLTGPGTIAAVGNGDLTSEELYVGEKRKLFQGTALVVVRSSPRRRRHAYRFGARIEAGLRGPPAGDGQGLTHGRPANTANRT